MQILPFIQDDPILQDNSICPVLILGLGNILLHDEGVGVRVVQQLSHDFSFPPEVEVMDGGTAGMALYEHIIDRTHLIVIDAVKTGRPPGSVVKLKGDALPSLLRNRVSPHQMALSDMLAALQISGRPLPDVTLIGIEPMRLITGIGLSQTVASQLDILMAMTLDCLQKLGYQTNPTSLY